MKKHILLIEDNADAYREFMELLGATGIMCKVTYTTSYDHALKILEYLSPDCVFMRRDIDGINSSACLHTIRQNAKTAHCKVVVFAEEVTTAIIKKAIQEGADYCIDQPRGMFNLRYLLADVLSLNSNSYYFPS